MKILTNEEKVIEPRRRSVEEERLEHENDRLRRATGALLIAVNATELCIASPILCDGEMVREMCQRGRKVSEGMCGLEGEVTTESKPHYPGSEIREDDAVTFSAVVQLREWSDGNVTLELTTRGGRSPLMAHIDNGQLDEIRGFAKRRRLEAEQLGEILL